MKRRLASADELAARVARAREEVAHLEAEAQRLERGLDARASNEALVDHLLHVNEREAVAVSGAAAAAPPTTTTTTTTTTTSTTTTLPLPVPKELETPERLARLLTANEGLFAAGARVRLRAKWTSRKECVVTVASSDDALWYLEANVTIAKTGLWLSVGTRPSSELDGLVRLAERRRCLRTLVVGFAEYMDMVHRRRRAVDELERVLGSGGQLVRDPVLADQEEGAPPPPPGTMLELRSASGEKRVRIQWTAAFVGMPETGALDKDGTAPEILVETVRVVEVGLSPRASEEDWARARAAYATGNGKVLDTLTRLTGSFPAACVAMVRAMDS